MNLTKQNAELIDRLDRAMENGTTGRHELPNLLRDCRAALSIGVAANMSPKEAERLQRLRDYGYQIQNRLDNMPKAYEMGRTRARLSAVCWAVEKICGIPFRPASIRPEEDAKAQALSVERAEQETWATQFTCPNCGPCTYGMVTTKKTCFTCDAALIRGTPGVPAVATAGVAVEGTYLSVAAANHLRRLVAWVRCEIPPPPEQIVDTVHKIAPAIGDMTESAKARMVEWHRESSSVPKYIRAAIKSLEKSIAGVPDET